MIDTADNANSLHGYEATANIESRQMDKLVVLIVGLILTLLAYYIRLHHLAADSFWVDEILTLEVVRQGPLVALGGVRDHPPLMYLLNALALLIFGENEFAARLVSLAAGTLAVPLLLLLGRIMNRQEAGIVAALLLAVAPMHIRHSQEARHYALLVCVSLAATNALILAMRQPSWRRWMTYAVLEAASLYTHYAAFLILASHGLLILLWLLFVRGLGMRRKIMFAASAVLMTLVLFLPQAGRFLESLGGNVGAETITGTGSIAATSDWLDSVYRAFGMYDQFWQPLLLAAAIAGILLIVKQGDWPMFMLLVVSIGLPFILIQIGEVARGATPRYVIFVLPYYLLAAALLPGEMLYRAGRRSRLVGLAAGALVLLLAAVPAVKSEYAYVVNDWRAVAATLAAEAEDGDQVAMLTMNFPEGFNIVSITLPYYLGKPDDPHLHLLNGGRLTARSVQSLPEHGRGLWLVVFDHRNPENLLPGIEAERRNYPSHVSLLKVLGKEGQSSLDQLITVTEAILPAAVAPDPRCLFEKDLALFHLQAGEATSAVDWLKRALEACPDVLKGDLLRYDEQRDIIAAVYEGAILQAQTRGQTAEAQQMARELLGRQDGNPAALEALAVANLLAMFDRGEAIVTDQDQTEPLAHDRWLMPGEAGESDLLFMHPPGAASFVVDLPQEPATLRTRIGKHPYSWEWGGDGVTFLVDVTDEAGTASRLLEQTVSNDAEDRRWYDIRLSLAPFAGQKVTITLATAPGSGADFTGDWAGWESPRVVSD